LTLTDPSGLNAAENNYSGGKPWRRKQTQPEVLLVHSDKDLQIWIISYPDGSKYEIHVNLNNPNQNTMIAIVPVPGGKPVKQGGLPAPFIPGITGMGPMAPPSVGELPPPPVLVKQPPKRSGGGIQVVLQFWVLGPQEAEYSGGVMINIGAPLTELGNAIGWPNSNGRWKPKVIVPGDEPEGVDKPSPGSGGGGQ
jgi:hypothetical protein